MRKYRPSSSPFYDKEFAAQPFKRANGRHTKPPREPDRYSQIIGCADCHTPARIEPHPTKTIYRCPACQALLATITPHAEVTTP